MSEDSDAMEGDSNNRYIKNKKDKKKLFFISFPLNLIYKRLSNTTIIYEQCQLYLLHALTQYLSHYIYIVNNLKYQHFSKMKNKKIKKSNDMFLASHPPKYNLTFKKKDIFFMYL